MVVQEYINNPLLIDGLKFDIRIYVLMTSIEPLRLYIFEDGLVRFATRPYSNKMEDLADNYIHLTNYTINKVSIMRLLNLTPGCSDFFFRIIQNSSIMRFLESSLGTSGT